MEILGENCPDDLKKYFYNEFDDEKYIFELGRT